MGTVQEEHHRQLHLDNVLSSQPELGPNIPDGGYGWVVTIASMFFHIMVPSISIGLGVIVLFHRIENGAGLEPQLWDSNMVYTCLFFIITSTICAPLCKFLSAWSIVATSAGTSLTSGGLLLLWTTIHTNRKFVYALAGIFSGGGACIILTQTNIVLSQYFKLKIELIRTIMHLSEAIGFIITPIALGFWIVKHGILHVIIWYQAIILQGIIFSIAFKKPYYLKSSKQKYKLIRGLSDEEEDVFAKNTTELQQPRILEGSASDGNTGCHRVTQELNAERNINPPYTVPKTWETFEDPSVETSNLNKTRKELHESFAIEFAKDLNKNNTFENSYVELPKQLFSEPQINNNTSYDYGSPIEINNEPIVFMPIEKPEQHSNLKKVLYVLRQPTFYKTLLLFLTEKCTVFVFWSIFPTYLYTKIDYLKVHDVPIIVGSVGMGSLIYAPLLNWIKSNRKIRPIFFWIFCWIGAIGYIILDTSNKTLFIFGAFVVILGINALQILGHPLGMLNTHGEQSTQFVLLNTITGFMLIMFLTIDISYTRCFQCMSVLNFLTGSLWLVNFLYKKIKNLN